MVGCPAFAGNAVVIVFLKVYTIYILKSLKYGRYYIGCTKDLSKRLNVHKKKVRSTKAYSPWKIIHIEYFESKSEAFCRERKIKSYRSGEAFKELIK